MDDFLVNDDNTGGCRQELPAIARDPSGNFIITWSDERNGYRDIYAQRYNSSGITIDSNFKVNDDTGTAYLWYPAIAMDNSGNFVITWEDFRNGNYDIYAQRYDSAATPSGSNFNVNDDTGIAYRNYPDIAIDDFGNFVITWYDYRNGNYDIYAQRYYSSGTPKGSNFKVNDDLGTVDQLSLSIAMNDSGNYVITWGDYRNGNWDIYYQRYDSADTSIGSNYRVNDDAGTAEQWYPDVVMDNSGNYVITWNDRREGNMDIYFQQYDSSGAKTCGNFRVNDDAGTASQWTPEIVMDSGGNFVIAWEDSRSGWPNYDIYAQRYYSSCNPVGSNFKVSDDPGTAEQWYPAIAMDGSGNFVITWMDWRNDNQEDIYAQRYNSTGAHLSSNFKVNDDGIGTESQSYPAIATTVSGKFIIAWIDERNGNYNNSDIYVQMYDSSGMPRNSNFKVIGDAETSIRRHIAIAINNLNYFVITWDDQNFRNGWYYDIYAQRYDSSGTPLGLNFRVNDDTGSAWRSYPSISMNGSGNFVITWYDYRNDNYDIYAQRYYSSGTPIGSNFEVNDDVGTASQYYPAIAMDSSGNFVITWYDIRSYRRDIYAQRYDHSGTPLGYNFKVNNKNSLPPKYPDIAMNGFGDFIITWEELGYRNIVAQKFDSSGTPLDSNFKVNDDIGTAPPRYPAIAMDESGKFIITWEDYRNGQNNPDIYAQRYNSSGGSIGNNYLVPNTVYTSFAQQYPAVAANSSKIYYTWQDNRRAKGWDIYANIFYFLRGNVNGDDKVSLSDIVYLINYLFKFGPEPIPELGIGDANCDGKVSLGDIVYLINYLFKFGPPPCP